jgi:hypothetical protein
MPKKPRPNATRAAPQKKPSLQAILRFLGRAGLRLLWLVASAWIWIVDGFLWAVSWLWHRPLRVLGGLWGFLFRIATLLSVGYLVYDRVYEADATLSASASDPTFAFAFPFTITNNSHMFVIREVKWACQALKVKFGNNNTIADSQIIRGSTSAIERGQSLNIDCSIVGPNSHFFHTDGKVSIDEAVVKIALSYDADFFGWFSLHRTPEPTIFTWFTDATNPQWIKGNFAK